MCATVRLMPPTWAGSRSSTVTRAPGLRQQVGGGQARRARRRSPASRCGGSSPAPAASRGRTVHAARRLSQGLAKEPRPRPAVERVPSRSRRTTMTRRGRPLRRTTGDAADAGRGSPSSPPADRSRAAPVAAGRCSASRRMYPPERRLGDDPAPARARHRRRHAPRRGARPRSPARAGTTTSSTASCAPAGVPSHWSRLRGRADRRA